MITLEYVEVLSVECTRLDVNKYMSTYPPLFERRWTHCVKLWDYFLDQKGVKQ